MSKKTKITIAGGSKIYSRPVSTLRKKISITIAVVLIVLSIPFCTRWFSTVKYYFSDERKQASFLLEFSLTGISTVEVRGQENCQGDEIIIPEKTICCGYLCTVTSIGRGAFSGCSGITSVKIPSSVTEIGEGAFKGCSSLTSIEIPSSVTEIGEWAFADCSRLTSVEIPSSVTEIGDRAFKDCSSLTSIEIPSSVTEIGDEAFKNCDNLNIVIDNTKNNVKVGKDAFEGCKSVTWKKDM